MDQVKSIAKDVAVKSIETTKKVTKKDNKEAGIMQRLTANLQATHTVVEQVQERKIYEKTLEAGQNISHKTFDALEVVGKRAMDILVGGVCKKERL